jgi:hypothetical protein
VKVAEIVRHLQDRDTREVVMTPRSVLGKLVVLSVLFVALSGCSKKEEAPKPQERAAAKSSAPAPEPAAPQTSVQTTELQTPEPTAMSATMEQFLERKVRMRPAAAGDEIQAFFTSWEEMLKRRSRQPLDIHFEVEVDGQFAKDHTWESATNRGILDEVCRECDLAWTIVEPNTIRITRKTE